MDVICEYGGVELSIHVGYCDTVLEIKEMIQKYHGVPVADQSLFFNGDFLSDDSLVARCLIVRNSRIQLYNRRDQDSKRRRILDQEPASSSADPQFAQQATGDGSCLGQHAASDVSGLINLSPLGADDENLSVFERVLQILGNEGDFRLDQQGASDVSGLINSPPSGANEDDASVFERGLQILENESNSSLGHQRGSDVTMPTNSEPPGTDEVDWSIHEWVPGDLESNINFTLGHHQSSDVINLPSSLFGDNNPNSSVLESGFQIWENEKNPSLGNEQGSDVTMPTILSPSGAFDVDWSEFDRQIFEDDFNSSSGRQQSSDVAGPTNSSSGANNANSSRFGRGHQSGSNLQNLGKPTNPSLSHQQSIDVTGLTSSSSGPRNTNSSTLGCCLHIPENTIDSVSGKNTNPSLCHRQASGFTVPIISSSGANNANSSIFEPGIQTSSPSGANDENLSDVAGPIISSSGTNNANSSPSGTNAEDLSECDLQILRDALDSSPVHQQSSDVARPTRSSSGANNANSSRGLPIPAYTIGSAYGYRRWRNVGGKPSGSSSTIAGLQNLVINTNPSPGHQPSSIVAGPASSSSGTNKANSSSFGRGLHFPANTIVSASGHRRWRNVGGTPSGSSSTIGVLQNSVINTNPFPGHRQSSDVAGPTGANNSNSSSLNIPENTIGSGSGNRQGREVGWVPSGSNSTIGGLSNRQARGMKKKKMVVMVWKEGLKKKIPVEVKASDKVTVLRRELRKLDQIGHIQLPPDGYFFIHKQSVMEDDKSFHWHHVDVGDTIEVFPGTVTPGSS